MFLIFNKQKIYTYLISIVTVVLLFCIAGVFTNNKEAVSASATNEKWLPIYNVKTDQTNVALTMNCAW